MSAPPDRIWAWTWNYSIARAHGTNTWTEFKPSPIEAVDLRGSFNPLEKAFWSPKNEATFQDVQEYVLASTIPAMIAEAVAKEREACAWIADNLHYPDETKISVSIRDAIRARKGDAND